MSCRLGSCQHPPATSTLQLSVSPHVLCQTFAHLTFDVSMEGSGRVHTRCSSPRKYSRKRGPHHVRAHLSSPLCIVIPARAGIHSLVRHSPEPFSVRRGVLLRGTSPRRRESN